MKNDDFSMFPKITSEQMRESYDFSSSDELPSATLSQKKYITTLMYKKDLDMIYLYDLTGKDIDELNIDEASHVINHLKNL